MITMMPGRALCGATAPCEARVTLLPSGRERTAAHHSPDKGAAGSVASPASRCRAGLAAYSVYVAHRLMSAGQSARCQGVHRTGDFQGMQDSLEVACMHQRASIAG